MFKKNNGKIKKSLLEEIDDKYLEEGAGISKVGSAIGSSAYIQPDMFRAFDADYGHRTGTSGFFGRKLF